MKLLVLVKQVPDPEALVSVAGERALEIEAKLVTSFFDEIAVEQALRLREAAGGTVTAVTVGTGKAVDALRRALAMGADRAVQIDDPALAEADGMGVARALGAFARAEAPDLVLCGRVSGDVEAGLVGPVVAELLGCPHAMAVVGLELLEGGRELAVRRQLERGVEFLALPLPAVVGAHKGLCEPRVPKVMQVMKAGKASIERLDLAALDLVASDVAPTTELVRYEAPRRRGPVRMVEGEPGAAVDELVRLLRDEARVLS